MTTTLTTLKRGATLSVDAPDGATKWRLGGAGKLLVVEVVDGAAVIDAATSATLPAGDYGSEWEVVGDGAAVALPAGPRIRVVESLHTDSVRQAPATKNERILAAAQRTLETAAESAEVSLAVDGASFSFESRGDLLRFVREIELRVARERHLPRRVERMTL